ncbi:MAG: DHH family phosphoesterase [Candidatus Micrarchaeaceae archaeon]
MENIGFKSLRNIIEIYRSKKVLLTFHSIGDTDAISSAIALQKFFKNAAIVTPDFITGNSKRILEGLGFKPKSIKAKFDDSAEMVVLLDVNNFEDCGAFAANLLKFSGPILIIDHHTPNKIRKDNVFVFNDESYNSAASIIYELLKSEGVSVDRNTAALLATGIISDSAELRNAFPNTFIQIGELLMKAGIDYQPLLLKMHHVASPKSRLDFMNDLFESKVIVDDNMLMLYGQARMHANKVADDAIRIGADVALFYTISKREISFSARLRPPLDAECDINLGKTMKSLAPLINGNGGGHPCAAGAYGTNRSNAPTFIKSFISEIRKKFGEE